MSPMIQPTLPTMSPDYHEPLTVPADALNRTLIDAASEGFEVWRMDTLREPPSYRLHFRRSTPDAATVTRIVATARLAADRPVEGVSVARSIGEPTAGKSDAAWRGLVTECLRKQFKKSP